jgi:hypothetical protein
MNRKFCVMFATSNYYDMFDGCQYKYSRANHDEVVVVNVDINSTKENKQDGIKTCERLGIHFVNPDFELTSTQQSVLEADKYLTKNNIDVDWIVCFQHDVIPMESNFWDNLDKHLENVDTEKVSMFSPNSIMDYKQALRSVESSDVIYRNKTITRTGRGNLEKGILEPPYAGWYKFLPDEYYKEDYFVVESPYWTCVGFNRKLFRENIHVDTEFIFELWPDDIAHQFMKEGFINITFPNLLVCHDHYLKRDVQVRTIDRNNSDSGDFCREQLRFWKKHGFRWGYRNSELRNQFNEVRDQYENSIQEKLFEMNISDGPKKVEDFI